MAEFDPSKPFRIIEDEYPVFDYSQPYEEADPETNILGAAKDIGIGLLRAPLDAAASAASIIDDPYTRSGMLDPFIESRRKSQEEYINAPGLEEIAIPGTSVTRGEVRGGMSSLGYSGAAMGASFLPRAAGAAIGAATGSSLPLAGTLTGAVIGWLGGAGAAGAASYQMDTNNFITEYRAFLENQTGREITDEEFATMQPVEVAEAIKAHGLHEAGWEGIGNMIERGAMTQIFKGGGLSAKALKGLASFVGFELGSETATQIGQTNAEVDIGMRPESQRRSFTSPEDIATSAREVLPATVLLAGVGGGGAYVAGKIADIGKAETIDDAISAAADAVNAPAVEPVESPVEEILQANQEASKIYRDQPMGMLSPQQPAYTDTEAQAMERAARIRNTMAITPESQAPSPIEMERVLAPARVQEYEPEAPQGAAWNEELQRQGEQTKAATEQFKPTAEPLTASTDTLIDTFDEIPVNQTPRTITRKAEGGFYGGAQALPKIIRQKTYTTEKMARSALKLLSGKKLNAEEYDVFPATGGWQIRSKQASPTVQSTVDQFDKIDIYGEKKSDLSKKETVEATPEAKPFAKGQTIDIAGTPVKYIGKQEVPGKEPSHYFNADVGSDVGEATFAAKDTSPASIKTALEETKKKFIAVQPPASEATPESGVELIAPAVRPEINQPDDKDMRGTSFAITNANGAIVSSGSIPSMADAGHEASKLEYYQKMADKAGGELFVGPQQMKPSNRPDSPLIMGKTWEEIQALQQGKRIPQAISSKMPAGAVSVYKAKQESSSAPEKVDDAPAQEVSVSKTAESETQAGLTRTNETQQKRAETIQPDAPSAQTAQGDGSVKAESGFVQGKQESLTKDDGKESIPIDLEDYLAQNGAGRFSLGEAAMHKNIPEGNIRKRLLDNQNNKDNAILKRRDELRKEYEEKVASGELRPLTRNERLINNANGNDDNEAVKAARRILDKRGIDWRREGKESDVKYSRSSTAGQTFAESADSFGEKDYQLVSDFIENDPDTASYGFRVIPHDMPLVKVGDELGESYLWDFENDTSSGDKAGGSSAIHIPDYLGVDSDEVRKSLKLAMNYGGRQLVLVKGNGAGWGDGDTGEIVISEAKVIASWGKTKEDKSITDISGIKNDTAFSRGKLGGQTVDAVKSAVSKSSRVRRMMEAGKLKVVATADELPRGAQKGIAGAYYGKSADTMYLVAEGIEAGSELSIAYHEAFHRAAAKGDIKPILDELGRMEKMAGKKGTLAEWFTKAREAAQVDKDSAHYHEELGAYAVQGYESAPATIKKWVDRLIAKVELVLFKTFGVMPKNLSPAFLREVALTGLNAGVVKESLTPELAYSRSEIIAKAKAFYSKLQQIVDAKFAGMKAQSTIPFLLKQGVKKAEIEATGLTEWLAAKGGTAKVSKQELADFVKANTLELEDVVLGEKTKRWEGVSKENAKSWWYEGMITKKEYDSIVKDGGHYVENIPEKTHFSQYTEPGAEEGSYREMFVAVPKKELPDTTAQWEKMKKALSNDDYLGYESASEAWGGIKAEGDNWSEVWDASPETKKAVDDYRIAYDQKANMNWQDGHPQYSDIKNPVVRIRFNTRTDTQGRSILFIEEMQGPNPENQKKMPKYLRENIYNLGAKRVLAYAKENGFDGVAWTSGETQTNRYSLEKQINSISYWDKPGDGRVVDYEDKEGNAHRIGTVDDKGTILRGPDKGSNISDVIGKEHANRILADKKTRGVIEGIDLKIGGEGLKQLYDVDLPNLFKAYGKGNIATASFSQDDRDAVAAQIYGRGETYENLPSASKEKVDSVLKKREMNAQFIPITSETPENYTLYSRKESDVIRYSRVAKEQEEVSKLESEASVRWLPGKKDISKFDRMFSTIEKYAEKVPTVKRYWDVIRHRQELKFKYENAQLKVGGLDAVKQWGNLPSKDQKEFSEYMVKADANFPKYQRKQAADGTWTAYTPDGNFKELSEDESAQTLFDKEHAANLKSGMRPAVADAIRTARMVNYAGFTMNIEALRNMQESAEKASMDEPTIAVVVEGAKFKVTKKGKEDGKAFRLFASLEEVKEFIGDRKNPADWVYSELENETKTQQLTINEAISMMGDLAGNYFPRVRKTGDYILRAYDKDGKEKYMKLFDAAFEESDKKTAVESMKKFVNFGLGKFQKYLLGADDLHGTIREMKKKGWRVEISENTNLSEDVFEAPQLLVSMQNLLDSALESSAKDKQEAVEQLNKIITLEIAKIFKMRGSLSSRLKRKPTVIAGYETDAVKAIISHVKSLAGGMAKRETSEKAMKVIMGRDISWADYQQENPDDTYKDYMAQVNGRRLDPGKQKEAYGAVMANFEWSMRNQTKLDRLVGTLKGLATLKYLGFRLASPAVNMTNMLTGVPAAMHANGVSFAQASLHLNKAAAAYVGKRAGYKKVFDYISAQGWDEAQFNQDAAGYLQSQAGKGYDKIMAWGMFIFGATEKFNRAATIAASYRAMGGSAEKIDTVLMKKARDISDEAHGVYQKETLPEWAMGEGFPAAMARTGYTFTKFTHNYLLNLKRYGWSDKQDLKAASWLLISPAILAGASASAISPLIVALAKALGEDDPEEDFFKWVEENIGIPDQMTRQGLSGLFGVDIRGSMGVRYGLPTSIKELLGAPYSVVEDVVVGVQKISKGETGEGIEKILPSGIGAPLKAAREYSEGLTTESNQKVFGVDDQPIKGTGVDAALRALSFNPARLSAEREKIWHGKEKSKRYSGMKSDIYADMRKYLSSEDRNIEDWAELLMRVEDYNTNIVENEEAQLITEGQIKSLIKKMRVVGAREKSLAKMKLSKFKSYEKKVKKDKKEKSKDLEFSE